MVMVVVVIVGDNDDGISRRNALEVHAIALLRDPAALSLSLLSLSRSPAFLLAVSRLYPAAGGSR